MFWLVKKIFIRFVRVSRSLATKCMSLNNKPFMVKPFLVDLNPVELKDYLFTISLDEWNGNCNAVNDLSTKICVPSKTKDVNVKVFNMITRLCEAKTLVKHISSGCKYKFIVQNVIQIKNGIMINVNVSVATIKRAKRIIVGILANVFVKIEYLKIYKIYC